MSAAVRWRCINQVSWNGFVMIARWRVHGSEGIEREELSTRVKMLGVAFLPPLRGSVGRLSLASKDSALPPRSRSFRNPALSISHVNLSDILTSPLLSSLRFTLS